MPPPPPRTPNVRGLLMGVICSLKYCTQMRLAEGSLHWEFMRKYASQRSALTGGACWPKASVDGDSRVSICKAATASCSSLPFPHTLLPSAPLPQCPPVLLRCFKMSS